MNITITERERDTILAALRCWQRVLSRGVATDFDGIATNDREGDGAALNADEIDALCERTNCTAASPSDTSRVRYVCTTCGGDDIRWDAWAAWSAEDQRMELASTFTATFCVDCGGECSAREVPMVED